MGGSKITLAAEWRKYCGARQEWNQRGYMGVVKEKTQSGKQGFQSLIGVQQEERLTNI